MAAATAENDLLTGLVPQDLTHRAGFSFGWAVGRRNGLRLLPPLHVLR